MTIETEISTLEEKDTWEYVDRRTLPRGTNILRSKFVFDIKRDSNGDFLKYKARMVAMGFTQVHGVDFDTFASVLTSKTFRILQQQRRHTQGTLGHKKRVRKRTFKGKHIRTSGSRF